MSSLGDPEFFVPSRAYSASEIAVLTGARLHRAEEGARTVTGISSAADSQPETLIFIDSRKNAGMLRDNRAAILLCPKDVVGDAPNGLTVLVSNRPQYDFATVGRLMFPSAARPEPMLGGIGVSERAFVHPETEIEEGAIIEAGAVVGPGAAIGRGTVIAPCAVVGPNCRIGRDSYLGPNATVQYGLLGDRVIIHAGARIGQDGFGFVGGPTGAEKLPHIGRVVIQDDVEIGANTTVDRGALSDTVIGQGTKIDNLVQIAHNVRIGRHCLIAAHCGLSGSVTLGDGVMLGGRVGLADHLTVGDRAALAASAGVMHDVPAGEQWAGSPARPMKDFFREVVMLKRLLSDRKGKGKDDE